jgi:hypothetical protein
MPEEDSSKVVTTTGGRTLHGFFRTHEIAIYREASERVERRLTAK